MKILKEDIDNFVWVWERAKHKTKYCDFPIDTILNFFKSKAFKKSFDENKLIYINIPFLKWFKYDGKQYSKLYSLELKECLYKYFEINED